MELIKLEALELFEYEKTQKQFFTETLDSGLAIVSFRPVNGVIVSLDFDSPEVVNKRLTGAFSMEFTGYTYATKSKSGNSHIYLTLTDPKSLGFRSAYAAYFGSDPIREALSTKRFYEGEETPFNMVETMEELPGLEAFLKQATPWAEYTIYTPEDRGKF